MYPTSALYQTQIYSADRLTKGRVTFDISDTTAAGDVSSITTTTEFTVSAKAQLVDKIRTISHSFGTCEPDRFLLNGSYSFADDTLANDGEVGFCSNSLCSSDGRFGNMCPTFDKWTGLPPQFTATIPTLMTEISVADNTYCNSPMIAALPSTNYVMSCTHNGSISFACFNSSLVYLGGEVWSASGVLTALSQPNTAFIQLTIRNYTGFGSAASGTFTFANLQFELGTVPTAFQAQNYQTIQFIFTSVHSSIGLTITFDTLTGEYATDFDMSVYDATIPVPNLIQTVSVTGNTLTTVSPIGQLTNYKKVIITIKKWSVPYRRARVTEVDFGVVKVYTDDNLISLGLIEQMDLTSGTMPSSEFKFTVDNSDRAFNIMNPVGFYKGLQQQQQVIGEIGLDLGNGTVEYIPLGNYLLYDWNSDEGSLTASFTARTNLDSMANFTYVNLTPNVQSLYAFAVAIFAVCGITNYVIDSSLSSINTDSLVNSANCRDILQMIAIAGCASVSVTRSNVIMVEVFPAPLVLNDSITLDNLWSEAQVALDNGIKSVLVTFWTDLSTPVVVTVNSSLTIGDTMNLTGNTLINTNARATAVANWILTQKGYRAIQTATWRGNPAEELGDIIDIENSYGLSPNSYVTKVQLDYAGYLSGVTEARGVPN